MKYLKCNVDEKKYKVPEVLLQGNHKEIKRWRNNNKKQKGGSL
jgi:tRNA (guanine-N1)-methyltransferase